MAQDSVGLQTQVIYDLSGGMVTNYNFTRVKRNQCQLILNSDLIVDGCIQSRKGKIKLNSEDLEEHSIITSLATIGQNSNADLILATAGGVLYELSTGINITVRSGLSSTDKFLTTNLNQYLFYVNGVDTPFMTQGSAATTYRIGIVEVTNAQFAGFSGVAAAGGDGTNGTHRIAFRYRSTITGARSNPNIVGTTISSISINLGAGNNTYSLTVGAAMVSADLQVDTIDYFVQEAGAALDSDYYYLGSSANAVGVYNFGTNVSDNELIVLETLDIDDDPPPNSIRDIQAWRARLLGILDDYHIGYSKIRTDENSIVDLPTSWPPDNSIPVGYGDGDPLVKIVIANDYVLAFKRRSVWILLGDFDSPQFGFKRLKANYTNVGLLNPQSIVQGGERFFFVTDDLKFYWFGITDFSTEQIRLSEPPASDPVSDVFLSFASSYRDNVNLVNYNFNQFTQIWISFSNSVSGTDPSQNYNTFVFDWTSNGGNGAWHIHSGLNVSCSVLARDSQRNYNVYTGDYYGYVWQHNTTDGDGAEINGTSTGSNYTEIEYGALVGGPFLVGEVVTGVSSGTSGTVIFQDPVNVRVNATNGLFIIGEQIVGATSLATAIILDLRGIFNDTTQNFTDALVGVNLSTITGTGADQIRLITSVPSATQVVVQSGWVTNPNNTTTYSIGGIDWTVWSRNDWCDEQVSPTFDKLGWFLDLDLEGDADFTVSPFAALTLDFFINRNFTAIPATIRGLDGTASLWGFGIWSLSLWAGTIKNLGQVGFNLYFRQISHKIRHRYAGYFYKLNGWVYTFQTLDQVRRL